MRIEAFRIENFRNLKLAECSSVPEFMVICGGNGCGKSALLEALMTAKEVTAQYGGFVFDPSVVSADAEKSSISLTLSFSEEERDYVSQRFAEDLPERGEIVVEIFKDGNRSILKNIGSSQRLLSFYSSNNQQLGFFDYISAHRIINKLSLQNWSADAINDEVSRTALSTPQNKFHNTKPYLASLKMRDLQEIQRALREGKTYDIDSLKDIRELFNAFFSPMSFKDVFLDRSPFGFIISTPRGDIDIDDLSSGEKEILNLFVRYHQLRPHKAIILFDEADAHLHPDLERRYLAELIKLTTGNQVFLTTHSPEMMIAAGSEMLYTILREPPQDGSSQLLRVTESDHLHNVLAEMMGSRGIVSFNQRIIFIEGETTSADRAIYEAFYPPAQHNVTFVPAGDSSTVRRTAERVNELLTVPAGFQQYFSIVDRDMERAQEDPTGGKRLFRLPVYHVENFLLNDQEVFETTRVLLGAKCPYPDVSAVTTQLESLLLSSGHLKPYARAILDAKVALAAKEAYDAVYKGTPLTAVAHYDFPTAESEAKTRLEKGIAQGTWREDCKGRDLLRSFCLLHGLNYEHFRNSLIARLKTPPKRLDEIMQTILRN